MHWDQDALVAAIGAVAGKKTVVVARCSGAFAMPWLDSVASVLYQLMPGQAGGQAAANAIVGSINPSGKLPISMPTSIDSTWLGVPLNPVQYPGVGRQQLAAYSARDASQVSSIQCSNSDDYQRADYSIEGLHVGYRWYATPAGKANPPHFHFG